MGMSTVALQGKISFFLIGALSILAVVLLTGASGTNPVGRYQIEIVVRNNITQIYVMDTTTGTVKWVDDMNKPFTEMKGD